MRYTYYASTARKEGYVQISNIFTETADNEKEHAKRFFKFLAGDKEVNDTAIEITANFPVSFGSTKENLLASAAGENEEWDKMYPEFADIADEEGFPEIAAVFRNIADAEKDMKQDLESLQIILKKVLYLRKINQYYGNVITADMYMKEKKLQYHVLLVLILKHTLKYLLKLINQYIYNKFRRHFNAA